MSRYSRGYRRGKRAKMVHRNGIFHRRGGIRL